jgi:hypothetical protein
MKKLAIALLVVLAIFTSCDKDPDNNNPDNNSRVIRYEVTGNFTGTLTAAYTPASGGVTSEDVNSLPWSKEITYAANVTGASIGITGGGGVPGQKVTLVIKRGGIRIGAPIEQTVNSSGVFSIAGQPIIF